MNILIIGTGGLAKALFGMLSHMNRIRYGITIRGFVSESPSLDYFCGLPVICDDELLASKEITNLVIGNGNPKTRQKIYDKFSNHNFPSFYHPNSIFLGDFKISIGCTVMPGCIFEPDVTIGDFVHFESGVFVGHDVTIGDYCVINHSAGISGNVKIANGVLIGAGSTIIEHHQVGNGSTLGAGAVLTKNVPDGEVWIGIPAKLLKNENVDK